MEFQRRLLKKNTLPVHVQINYDFVPLNSTVNLKSIFLFNYFWISRFWIDEISTFSPINQRRMIELTVKISLFDARIENKANKQQIEPYFSQSTFYACYKMFASVKTVSETPTRVGLKFLRLLGWHCLFIYAFCLFINFLLPIEIHKYFVYFSAWIPLALCRLLQQAKLLR